jgi:hypothetical protein
MVAAKGPSVVGIKPLSRECSGWLRQGQWVNELESYCLQFFLELEVAEASRELEILECWAWECVCGCSDTQDGWN